MIRLFILFLIIFFSLIENSFSEESTIHLTPKNKNGTTDNAIINDEIIIEENGINVIEIGEGEDVNIFDTNLISEDNELISTENNINNSLNNLSNIWKDSNKKNINFLLEKLSRNLSSSIIKLNLINSLVYGNVPPSDMTQSEFDKLRIITLKNLGDIDSAIIVISNIDTYESNKDLYDKIILEKSLSDYNIAAVCGILDSNSNFNNDSFLLKTKIFCSILNGDYETADFLNSLLVEEDYDEFFQILFNKLIDVDKSENNYDIKNYKYDIDSISLYSAIMRSTDTPFSEDFFKLNSPQLLKAIAISPVTDISIRLEAAQKAFYYNSLNAESIAALYQSVDFSSEELNNPNSTIENSYVNDPQKAMALLFQSSRRQILPISRLEALNNFWIYSKSIGQSSLAYELSKDLLKSIEPTSELINFAIQTSKAYLSNNNIENSKKWMKLIKVKIDIEEQKNINKDYLQLVFLMNLKEGKYEIEDSMSDILFNNLDIKNEEINNLELYLTTLDFIGFKFPISLWEITSKKIKDDRKVPSIYVMKLMEQASSNNSLGELLLSIAVSMEENNWSEIHPQHVTTIFESLNNIKEDQIIKDLALEILENIG